MSLCKCLGIIVLVLIICVSNVGAATQFKIDINDESTSVTNEGWSVINASYDGGEGSVEIDGVTFAIIGADGARYRGDPTNAIPDALLADFVFDDGSGQDIGVSLGVAGSLQEGIWEVKVYVWDQTHSVGYSEIFYRENGEEHKITSYAIDRNDRPASTFTFYSDGVSAYDVFVRENNSYNRCRLCAIELRLLEYKIDINNADAPVTNVGWHALNASYSGGSGSVEADGVTFSTFSADGSRLRGSVSSPDPDPLLGDFVFDGGSGQAVGLQFGAAGDLPYAPWQADIYYYDADESDPVSLNIGFRVNAGNDLIVGTNVAQSSIGPAFSYLFQSDGASSYDMFTRTLTSAYASYLNAVHLKALNDAPVGAVILRYDMNDCSGYVAAADGTQTTPEVVDFLLPHFSASDISSITNWGMDVPPVNGNLARNSMDGYAWWSRAGLLPSGTNSQMYAEFSFAPKSGYNVDLGNGELRLHAGVGNWDTGTYRFQALLFKNEGGNLTLLDNVSSRATPNCSNDPRYCDMSLDLSSLGVITSSVTLRLYFIDSSGNNNHAAIIDTISVFGVEGGNGGTVILIQ